MTEILTPFLIALSLGADVPLAKEIALSPEPPLTLAIAYEESRLKRDRVSKAGACGPMQVLPKFSRYSCREMQGDHGIDAGLETLDYWRRRSETLEQALAHYNGGNKPGRRARAYARRVMKRRALESVYLDYSTLAEALNRYHPQRLPSGAMDFVYLVWRDQYAR